MSRRDFQLGMGLTLKVLYRRLVTHAQEVALVALVLHLSRVAVAQPPTDFVACEPVCREEEPYGIMVGCEPWVLWEANIGRTLWGPLRCGGPIEVSIEARSLPEPVEAIPLYLEVRSDAGTDRCLPVAGGLIWQTTGTRSCDSLWVTSQLLDLHLPIGTTYWIQMIGFRRLGPHPPDAAAESPFVRCLRVRALPMGVENTTWSLVKTLYRDGN